MNVYTAVERDFIPRLTNTHPISVCLGRPCVIHNPIDHHMRSWPMLWRADRGLVERVCPCGVGHPDPSQASFWIESGQMWQFSHGCCGCCAA